MKVDISNKSLYEITYDSMFAKEDIETLERYFETEEVTPELEAEYNAALKRLKITESQAKSKIEKIYFFCKNKKYENDLLQANIDILKKEISRLQSSMKRNNSKIKSLSSLIDMYYRSRGQNNKSTKIKENGVDIIYKKKTTITPKTDKFPAYLKKIFFVTQDPVFSKSSFNDWVKEKLSKAKFKESSDGALIKENKYALIEEKHELTMKF